MHPLTVVQSYLAAISENDVSRASGFLAETVALQVMAPAALGLRVQGRDAFLGAFAMMMRASHGTYRLLEQKAWLTGGDLVALVAAEETRVATRTVRFDRIILYRVEGARIAEVRVFEGDPDLAHAAFANAS